MTKTQTTIPYSNQRPAKQHPAVERFERAVRRHEMRGGLDPLEYDDIEHEYHKAKDALLATINGARNR